jgi:peroxiredoxin
MGMRLSPILRLRLVCHDDFDMTRRTSLFKACFLIIAAMTWGVSTGSAITPKKQAERKRAPDFELKDSRGSVVRLSDYAGRVVLVDFWATWCVPCKTSMPWFNELAEKHRDAGLTVIGISIDQDGWDVVNPFIDMMRVTYPIAIATKRVTYLYGDVESVPLAFFIDRDQRVAAIHSGDAKKKDFEKIVNILLAESSSSNPRP